MFNFMILFFLFSLISHRLVNFDIPHIQEVQEAKKTDPLLIKYFPPRIDAQATLEDVICSVNHKLPVICKGVVTGQIFGRFAEINTPSLVNQVSRVHKFIFIRPSTRKFVSFTHKIL